MALVRTRNETDGQGRKPVTLIHRNPEKLSDTQKQEMVDVGDVEKPSIDKPASVKPWLTEDNEIVWKATLRPDGDGFEEDARDTLGRNRVRELARDYADLLRALGRLDSDDRDRQARGAALLADVIADMKADEAISEGEHETLTGLMADHGISEDGEPRVLIYDDGEWVSER